MSEIEINKRRVVQGDVNQHTEAEPVKVTLRQDLGDIYRALDKFASNANGKIIGPAVTHTIKGISKGARAAGRAIVDKVFTRKPEPFVEPTDAEADAVWSGEPEPAESPADGSIDV